MTVTPYPPRVTRPRPWHEQTDAAEWGRERVRAYGRRRRQASSLDRAELVTKHAPPYLADPVTPGARRLEQLARDAGMRVQLVVTLEACSVEGVDVAAGIAFRAIWVRGKAKGGTWHERAARWSVADDRLVCLAGPWGVALGVTAIAQRVRERLG